MPPRLLSVEQVVGNRFLVDVKIEADLSKAGGKR